MSDVNESALKDALPWDTIAPAPHDQLNRVAPYVDTLRGLSQRRVAASLRFGYLAADLTRANEDLATKSVSLNEAERRLELDDTKLRQTERDNAPPAAKPTTYDITLGNASVAGLPPPETFSAETAKKAPEPSTTGAEDAPSPGKSAKKEDVLLNESIHVLADYVGLLRG
jgi:carboxyl-terminal processing protease